MAPMLGNGHCHSFNGDGKLDILTRDHTTGELFVFPHSGEFRGTETYLEPVKISDGFHPERDHMTVRTIDSTGDGRADVLGFSRLEDNGARGQFLYRNTGGLNGMDTLAEPIKMSSGRTDGRRWDTIGIADLTGSGPEDMFGRERDTGHVDAFYSRGRLIEDGSFDRTPRRLTSVGPDDLPIAMADVTGNGNLDLLVRRVNGDLDLYEFADDEAAEGTWYTLAHNWDQLRISAVTDLDLDGRPDFLGLRPDGTLVGYLHAGKFDPDNPLATFAEPEVIATGWQRFSVLS